MVNVLTMMNPPTARAMRAKAIRPWLLGPGHLRRLGGAPAGAEPLDAGRVEVVIGDARSWLPTLREQGRTVLVPCLVSRPSDVLRLIHQRFQGTSSDPEADGVAVRRMLRRFGRRPVPQLDELLADPERVTDFRLVARQRVLGDEPTQVAALAGRPALPLRSALRLWDLERPIALHLFAPPPPSIDGLAALPRHVLEAAGRWLVADAAEVRAVVDGGWSAYALSPADAVKLLTSWTEAAPETSLAAVSPDGRYRGKYQFSRATWRAMGGKGDPAAASEAEQDRIAAALYASQGASPWPSCGR